jgi:hypothetical protein
MDDSIPENSISTKSSGIINKLLASTTSGQEKCYTCYNEHIQSQDGNGEHQILDIDRHNTKMNNA